MWGLGSATPGEAMAVEVGDGTGAHPTKRGGEVCDGVIHWHPQHAARELGLVLLGERSRERCREPRFRLVVPLVVPDPTCAVASGGRCRWLRWCRRRDLKQATRDGALLTCTHGRASVRSFARAHR
jgi:hypothetical protein